MRAGKALVMDTLSDSFRIWPPSTTLWRDFQKDAEQFAFPHNRLTVECKFSIAVRRHPTWSLARLLPTSSPSATTPPPPRGCAQTTQQAPSLNGGHQGACPVAGRRGAEQVHHMSGRGPGESLVSRIRHRKHVHASRYMSLHPPTLVHHDRR